MTGMTGQITGALRSRGADLVGVGDLSALPEGIRNGLPVGISLAVKHPKDVIRGIADGPTRAYLDQYNRLNDRLDMLVSCGAELLTAMGYRAVPQTRANVDRFKTDLNTRLPHKTVATRAGLGWIGRSALFVTEAFGSMVRISSILTDAPLDTAAPVDTSRCGTCRVCVDACPAGAVSGRSWEAGLPRDALLDASACRKTARALTLKGTGVEHTLCGKCLEVCPYTRRYLETT